MEEINTCENCKFFDTRCKNPKLSYAQKRKRYRLGDCKAWEPFKSIESANEPQITLEQSLHEIAKQLSIIAELLQKEQY